MLEDEEEEGTPMSDESADIDISDLVLGNQIGSGSYGVVYRGTYFNTDVAIKKIHPGEHQKELQKYLKREVAVLKNIQHPNIVQFIGVYYEPVNHITNFLKSNSTWIVTEYIAGGDLHERIKNLSKPLPLSLVIKLSLDIALAMAYLHSRDIIFRDLKSKNILIDDTSSPIRGKVCDFGFARIVKNKQNNRHLSLVGSDNWMAPEVILGMEYDESADIFSFGILLIEMAVRKKISKLEFERSPQNAFEIDEYKAREMIPEEIPPLFTELIMECIKYDPTMRPTFPNIISTLKQLQSLFPIAQSYENPLSPHSSPIIPRKNSIHTPFAKIMRLNSFDLSKQCNNSNLNQNGFTNHNFNNSNSNNNNNSSNVNSTQTEQEQIEEKTKPINQIKIEETEEHIEEKFTKIVVTDNSGNSVTTTTTSLTDSITTMEYQMDLDEEEIQKKVDSLKDKMKIVLLEFTKFVKVLGKELLEISKEEEISARYEDCRKIVEIKKILGEIVEGEAFPITPRKNSNPPTTRIAIFLKTMERSIQEIKSSLDILLTKVNKEESLNESVAYARVIGKLKRIMINGQV
ncbi:LISK family protein kinase [Tieghemostelium lacteum]|uniref:non-specific serine/threonine protein kinase n=1 Tax=Tieghemostelium lacteum TaxID=361077 RepID=A0A151Z5M9_TIELA|nr:LISK family protein kinase [Tieghemostelium lacteum]|eukprot:KYQ89266.1 LISK family protein kinase [Tieghemostelium lacteum]